MNDNRQVTKVGIRPDGDVDKRFPNSISATVRAVVAWWLKTTEPEKHTKRTSAVKFADESDFNDHLRDTLDRFGGVKNKATNPADFVDKISRQVGTDFEYYRLRAFADFMGISESAFLTVAKLVSIDRRVDDPEERKEASRQYLRANIRFMREALKVLDEGDERFSITDNPKPQKKTWMANMRVVHRLVIAYNKENTSKFDAAMKEK